MNRFIDLDRIQRRLDALWEIGKTNQGGVSRLAYSDEETEAINYILEELSNAYAVTEDSIGNVFATRHPDADRSVYIGSHVDSVYNGGRLDGALGVVAGLEAIEAVHAVGEKPWLPPTFAVFRGGGIGPVWTTHNRKSWSARPVDRGGSYRDRSERHPSMAGNATRRIRTTRFLGADT